MTKTLRIPDEPRFVLAFALAVDPRDTLGLLMEIGALGSPDIGIVWRTGEALIPAYDRASDLKDWELAHTIGVLREALAQPDSAAYLAYHARSNHQTGDSATNCAEALAVIGCAADSLTSRRRPWEVEPNALSLPEWRERVWKLLLTIPCNALPKPFWPTTAWPAFAMGCPVPAVVPGPDTRVVRCTDGVEVRPLVQVILRRLTHHRHPRLAVRHRRQVPPFQERGGSRGTTLTMGKNPIPAGSLPSLPLLLSVAGEWWHTAEAKPHSDD